MPSGERYRLLRKKVLYDLSPTQFAMLKKVSIRIKNPLDWATEQRVRGLLLKGLFAKKNGSLVRTKLGSEVFTAIAARIKAQAKEN